MEIIKNYFGLEYVTVKLSKGFTSSDGLKNLEKTIAKEILLHHPLRGKELKFLRKILGLSCAKMAADMEGAIDPTKISRLERDEERRLSQINETFFRAYFLEKFNVHMNAYRSLMIPHHKDHTIELNAS